MATDPQVLVVGAGPTGLTTALLLARCGVDALLVERHPATSIFVKSRGIDFRSMEIFRALGITPAIERAAVPFRDNTNVLVVESLAGVEHSRTSLTPAVRPDAGFRSLSPSGYLLCGQDRLEPVLAETARAAGARLRFHTELVDFRQDATGVHATVLDRETGAQSPVHARYLVAADGARSGIRHRLGVPTTITGEPDRQLLVYFRADLTELTRDRLFLFCFVRNTTTTGILAPINNTDLWQLSVRLGAGEGIEDFPPRRCRDLVRGAVGRTGIDVEIQHVMATDPHTWVATQFRQQHVFLAGDAAHNVSSGLNSGIQDAHNLAWKLAEALSGTAGPDLLDSYHDERHGAAWHKAGNAAPPPNPLATDGEPAEDHDPERADMALAIGHRYVSTAVIAEPEPGEPGLDLTGRPGTRAPHAWLRRQGQRMSTLDLCDYRFVLLTGAVAWMHAADTVATRTRMPLTAHHIDADPAWAAAYGVTNQGAVLIRPDGYIAWRARETVDDPAGALDSALTTVLSR